MSAEHVATMNRLLASSAAVTCACRALGAPRVLGYDLADGPNGDPVHWTLTFDGSVRFSLHPAASPDLRFVGDWKQLIRAAKAGRSDESVDAGVSVQGDPHVLEEITPVLELARTVATVPVEFPEV